MLLALETSTNICSVALKGADGNLYEKRTGQRGSHSEKLFIFIEELMADPGFKIADLDGILVSEGPGSYTGLRISASAVKGLLFQTKAPLYAVNTLAGFAQSALLANPELQTIHSVIDARRVHFYHQKFSTANGNLSAETEVDILPIEKVQAMIGKREAIIGTGINRLKAEELDEALILKPDHISAGSLFFLFEKGDSPFIRQVAPEQFEPRYYTSRQVEGLKD